MTRERMQQLAGLNEATTDEMSLSNSEKTDLANSTFQEIVEATGLRKNELKLLSYSVSNTGTVVGLVLYTREHGEIDVTAYRTARPSERLRAQAKWRAVVDQVYKISWEGESADDLEAEELVRIISNIVLAGKFERVKTLDGPPVTIRTVGDAIKADRVDILGEILHDIIGGKLLKYATKFTVGEIHNDDTSVTVYLVVSSFERNGKIFVRSGDRNDWVELSELTRGVTAALKREQHKLLQSNYQVIAPQVKTRVSQGIKSLYLDTDRIEISLDTLGFVSESEAT